jgi:methanogenic corrinoid protein MtbC1
MAAERDLGSRWQQGDYLISEEHAATAAIETVIALLAGSFDQPSEGPSVVVVTAEGDDHSLPARAVSAHLLYLGYRTVLLGASVVASDLGQFLESDEPDALVLSCAMTTHLPGARAVIRESHAAGVPVIAGGSGFGEDGRWATAIGADAWVRSFREVADELERWEPDIEASEKMAADPDPELTRLLDDRPGLISAARSLLDNALVEPRMNARILSELGLILDALGAALLVDDPEIVHQLLQWQRSTLSAHGLELDSALPRALADAVGQRSPSAAAILERALDSE